MSVSYSLDSILEGIMEWGVKKGILYAGERIGQYGKPFRMYKFRTTKKDADLNPPETRFDKIRRDDLLWFGAPLRFIHLDELPQLYNVYRGDMGWVGPRPIIRKHWEQEGESEEKQEDKSEERVKVKPGLIAARSASFKPLTPEVIIKMENAFVKKAKEDSYARAQLYFALKMPYATPYRGILTLYNFVTEKQKTR